MRASLEDRPAIALVGPIPPPFGGVSVHVLRLRAALESAGWSVRLLATGRTPPSLKSPDAIVGNSPWRHFRQLLPLTFGIVHVHHTISALAWLSVITARRRGRPCVVTLHGPPMTTFGRRRGVDVFWRAALTRAASVIAIGPHVAEMVRWFVPDDRLTIGHAFLPPTPQECAEVPEPIGAWLGEGDRDSALITMPIYRVWSSVDPARDAYGLLTAVDAVQNLTRSGRQLSFALFVAEAPRNSDESAFLQTACERLQHTLQERFAVFCGLPAVSTIARSDVLLRPSLTDGDSVAVREALSLGVPVVASDSVARPSGVELHRTGDAVDLARAMSRVLATSTRQRGVNAPVSATEALLPLVTIYRRISGTCVDG